MADLHAEISKCCRKLRLSSNLADRAMTTKGRNNQEYLYKLLSNEIKSRNQQRIAKLVNTAGFPQVYGFDQFRPDEVEFQDTCLDELKSLEFYRQRKNIIMYGSTGTGKTMLSVCIGLTACRQGIPVKFFRTAALINQFSEHHSRGALSSLKKKLSAAEIIILDEFGYVPYDRTGAQLLFDYLSETESSKLIILSTNLEFSRWVNVLYDEQMTAALIGRLMHHCHLLLFPGQNNRLRESSMNSIYRGISDKAAHEETVHGQSDKSV